MKYASVGRALVAGALLGAVLYFAPFLFFPLRIILGIVLFVAVFRWLVWGGWGPRRWAYAHGYGPGPGGPWGGPGFGRREAMLDRIRAMSEEEYKAFREQRFGYGRGCYGRGGWEKAPETKASDTPAEPQGPVSA